MAKNRQASALKRESFVWPAPDKADKGFLWREDLQWADPSEEFRSRAYQLPPFLVWNPEIKRRRYVAVLEDAQACFLRFARLAGPDTPEQREAIRRFAGRYGFLTGGRWVAPGAGGEVEPGESLHFWRQEIQHMAWAVQVLMAMPDPKERIDDELLRRIIWWQRDRVGYILTNLPREELLRFRDAWEVFEFVRGEYRRTAKGGTPEERHRALFSAGWLAGVGKRDRIFRRVVWGALRRPALVLLADFIAKKLAEYPVALRIGMDAEKGELRSFPMPANLLSAMWLLLYRVVAGEAKLKKCAQCGEWGVAKYSNWRMHPECANAERQARHRRREKGGD
ncbi:MAG: hypothetical protein GX493_12195 [Firmicutes bacterium]|nr:hypothetical protein [Bacillota bacterium]